MFTTRAAVATALSVVAVSLTACGGSDSDTLNRSELASKGNAICKDIEPKVKAVKEPNAADEAALAEYFGKIAPYLNEIDSRLKGLKPADDVKSDWDDLTSSIGKTSDAIKTISDKVQAKDEAGAEQAGKSLDALGNQTDAAAKKIGLTACNN